MSLGVHHMTYASITTAKSINPGYVIHADPISYSFKQKKRNVQTQRIIVAFPKADYLSGEVVTYESNVELFQKYKYLNTTCQEDLKTSTPLFIMGYCF